MKRRILLACALGASITSALAIEAPQPSTTDPAPEVQSQDPSVVPNDETQFYRVLQRSAHHRNLVGLKISPAVTDMLASGDIAGAIVALSAQSSSGNNDANIALVRIQHWCNRFAMARVPDAQTQITKLPARLAPERAARAAGVIIAEEKYRQVARDSCARAQFDYVGIETRLREAAEKGDAASLTELSVFTRDAVRRQEMLQAAADKGFAPAQYALATSRLIAVQRGDTTENVASIRLLLKQAGRSLNKAKVDLANCMAIGCDGHPADTAAATQFGIDAARDGEPGAFISMARMSWGMRMDRAQLLAWQYFGDRLSEAGCVGEGYVAATVMFDQTIKTLERQFPTAVERARSLAETLWRDHGERAMREQGCSPPRDRLPAGAR